MGCPLTWASKLQTRIALSTMGAEYIALSQAMRDCIAIREVIQEIQTFMIAGKCKSVQFSIHSRAFTLDKILQSIVYEDNEACLKFSNMPKMSPRTKHIALPYYFFISKLKNWKSK